MKGTFPVVSLPFSSRAAVSLRVEGNRIQYNFVEPHMTLEGKTPTRVAGIEISGKTQWLGLLNSASKSKQDGTMVLPCNNWRSLSYCRTGSCSFQGSKASQKDRRFAIQTKVSVYTLQEIL